jgi:hypothetical protein
LAGAAGLGRGAEPGGVNYAKREEPVRAVVDFRAAQEKAPTKTPRTFNLALVLKYYSRFPR